MQVYVLCVFVSHGRFVCLCRHMAGSCICAPTWQVRVFVSCDLYICTHSASDSSSVAIRSSNLVNDQFVKTQEVLTWRVESIEGTGHVIPPNTDFKWTVRPLPS